MPIISKPDGDIVVANITERDSLSRKINTMQVTVLDASGDSKISSGAALYQWSSTLTNWRLLWAEEFSSESLNTRLNALENVNHLISANGETVAVYIQPTEPLNAPTNSLWIKTV